MKNEFVVEIVSYIFDYRKEEVGELRSDVGYPVRFEKEDDQENYGVNLMTERIRIFYDEAIRMRSIVL